MAPSFFLLFWCVVEVVSYGLSLLLIAILFWPMTRSRAEDGRVSATEEQLLGGGPCQSRSGHARRAGISICGRVVEAELAAPIKRYAIDIVLVGLARACAPGRGRRA
jgi:hypothetical protein